tara:strand:+ start:2611 stop:3003 length:393 start_codon:yes stop_codon:yes gene_type:complete
MGYYVTMDLGGIVISAEDMQSCLDTINALQDDCEYSWVDSSPPNGWSDLKVAFLAWRYEGDYDKDGDFHVHYFEGEKLGDDEALWNAVAPYLRDGGEISCTGEEADHWIWRFKDRKLEEGWGEIVYHFGD